MRIIEKSLCVMLFGLLTVMSIQGCGTSLVELDDESRTFGPELYPRKSEKNRAKTRLKKLNDKIDVEKGIIKRCHTNPCESRIVPVRPEDRRAPTFWERMSGKRYYTGQSTDSMVELVTNEMRLERAKKKLEKFEHEKQEFIKQSSGCFLPGTLVKMDDGSLKSFSGIQPGQRVLTYDIGYDKLVSKRVIEVYSVNANHLYKINDQLATTGGERLLTKNGWKKIRDLKKGEWVHIDGRMVKIKSIDYVRTNRTLYNMQVADTHNFYVVTTDGSSYLVHNSSGSAGGGSK